MTKRGEAKKFFEEVVLKYDGDECLLWPFHRNRAGYGAYRADAKSSIMVHRLACEAECGPPPTPEHHAAHSCGNGHLGCCARRHLSWKTQLGNAIDRVAQGRTKLTPGDIWVIRSLAPFVKHHLIARKFGVSISTVSRIALREQGAWVTEADAWPPEVDATTNDAAGLMS